MMNEYDNCKLCPRRCGIDRRKKAGYCGMTDRMMIARADLHFWEEPCISGKSGSGAVFFMGCPMHCAFCQNYNIANAKTDITSDGITVDRLAEIFFELKEKGANNINLVTADHFVPTVALAIEKAKTKGINIPFVYNTSSYINVETLKMLDGLIDVYLPDFKYMDSNLSYDLSKCRDYSKVALEAIEEMYRQVKKPRFYLKGDFLKTYDADWYNDMECEDEILIKSGVIVRHLILPGHENDSKAIIKTLLDKFGENIYLSVMNQYTPVMEESMAKKIGHEEFLNKLDDEIYNNILDYAIDCGIENGFFQDGATMEESFIPEFNEKGIS